MITNFPVAVVTGASRGIGRAIVEKLLENNYRVIGLSRKGDNLIHPNYTSMSCDVTDYDHVTTTFATIKNQFKKIDILINNAGIGIFKLMEDLTIDDWKAMQYTNIDAIFYCCKQIVADMKYMNTGYIFNISSIAGLTGISEASGYAATKFAVRGFSQSLQKELKGTNIKVTCIYPGSVNTDFFEQYPNVNANPSMLRAEDIAQVIIDCLRMPTEALISDIEIRPLNPSYK